MTLATLVQVNYKLNKYPLLSYTFKGDYYGDRCWFVVTTVSYNSFNTGHRLIWLLALASALLAHSTAGWGELFLLALNGTTAGFLALLARTPAAGAGRWMFLLHTAHHCWR
jgi:hypothetical protein